MALEIDAKKTTSERLSSFLLVNKKILLISVSTIVVILIAIGIIIGVGTAKLNKYTEKVENLQSVYSDWTNAEEASTEKEALYTTLEVDLKEIIANNSNNYPDMRASYLLAELYYESENYSEAAKLFISISEAYSDVYIAPLALMNAGVTYEQLGETDKAVELYQKVVDSYKNNSGEVAHALFSIGRIYDSQSKNDIAKTVYQELVQDYPNSEWAKLANSRLILL